MPETSVERVLGQVEGKLDQFISDCTRRDDSAKEGRERLYSAIEDLKEDVLNRLTTLERTQVSQQLQLALIQEQSESNANQITIFSPTIADYVAVKNKAEGAAKATGIIYSLLAGCVAIIVTTVIHFLEIFGVSHTK